MAVAITDKNYLPNANSIINGNAELTAVSHRNKVSWALPGGGFTSSRPFAMAYASRMNRMITDNMRKQNVSLLWS